MTGSRSLATLLVGLALTVLLAPAASAAATQTFVRDGSTLWTEASVDGPGQVTVTILAPKQDGEGREVWQRCRFQADAAGTYRCGIDVADGSLAAARTGTWVSKVAVEGTLQSKVRFQI